DLHSFPTRRSSDLNIITDHQLTHVWIGGRLGKDKCTGGAPSRAWCGGPTPIVVIDRQGGGHIILERILGESHRVMVIRDYLLLIGYRLDIKIFTDPLLKRDAIGVVFCISICTGSGYVAIDRKD